MESRVSVLETQNKSQFKLIDEVKCLINELGREIREVKDKLLGRPSWWVVGLIGGLASLCSGLAMFIITR